MASSLDREVEKPGLGSWAFHSLAETCGTRTGRLASANETSLNYSVLQLITRCYLIRFLISLLKIGPVEIAVLGLWWMRDG